VPFVDVAYQGFGEGIEEDVAGLRLMAEQVPQMLLTVSSSKSFGIYRERAGLLSIVFKPGTSHRDNIQRRMRDTARQLYFMAPNHGAALVHEIMSTPELESMWRSELDSIRVHVVSMRAALRNTMEQHNPGFNGSFLAQQHGMFSCLPITFDEQLYLEQEYHIYMLPPARVNVAAMNSRQSVTLAEAFADVSERRRKATQKAS
jgi:aspartate/tyrosine/aromatic aminotransferase